MEQRMNRLSVLTPKAAFEARKTDIRSVLVERCIENAPEGFSMAWSLQEGGGHRQVLEALAHEFDNAGWDFKIDESIDEKHPDKTRVSVSVFPRDREAYSVAATKRKETAITK